MAFTIGVDPGLKGGVAILRSDSAQIEALHPMPVKDGEVDAVGLASMLWLFWPAVDVCVVEKVHAMPDQGVTSMFCFGRGFGVILGVLAAQSAPLDLVTPQRWKRDILGTEFDHKDKAGTAAWAAMRWPEAELVLPRCRVPHSGIVDALALADWGVRFSRKG